MPGARQSLRQRGRFCAKAASKVVTRKPAGVKNPPTIRTASLRLCRSHGEPWVAKAGAFFISPPPHLTAETKTNKEEGFNYEHTGDRSHRGRVPGCGLCAVRPLDRPHLGHRRERQDPRRGQKRRQRLRSHRRLDGVQPPVLLHRGCRPRYRRHSGGGVRLGARAAVDSDWRRILRCRHRLRRPVCQREERGQVHGPAD